METCETLILRRDDMRKTSIGKDIISINITDFLVFSNQPLLIHSIILFVDNNGHTKILKNRFGDEGQGTFIRIINDIKENSIDNNLGYGEKYFDDIIDLINS